MAKLLVKKQDLSGELPFEEQIWPVYAALVVLGGYLVGTIFVFCPTDGPWYVHPMTLLPVVPLLIGAAMWALRVFDNRHLRRAIQLSAIISVIVHLTLLLLAHYYGLLPVPEVAKVLVDKKEVQKKTSPLPKLPETVWQKPISTRPRQDFEKPVETATPEPEQKQVEREENKPSEREPEPTPPQPIQVAKPEPTPQPAIERAKEPEQPTPRASPSQSLLTRNMNRTEAKPLPKEVQVAGAETKTQPDPRTVAGSTANIERKVTEPVKTPAPTVETTPTTPAPQPTVQLSQRAPMPMQPSAVATATPRLERKIAQPTEAPRTNAQVAAATAKPLETKPDQPRPEVAAATKQSPVAPEVVRNVPTPTPMPTPTSVPQLVERAEQSPRTPTTPPKPGPQIARATPNERPTPQQTLAANQTATQTRESPSKVEARDTPLERTVATVSARAPPTNPQPIDAPQPTPSPTPNRATPTTPSVTPPTPSAIAVERTRPTTQPTPTTTVAEAQPRPTPSTTAATTPQASEAAVTKTTPSASPTVVTSPAQPTPNAPSQVAQANTQRAETPPTPAPAAPTTPQPATLARTTPQTQPRQPTEAAAVNSPQATAQAAPNPTAVAAQAAAIEKSAAEVHISAQANQQTAPTAQPSTAQPANTPTIARAAAAQPTQVVQSTPTPTPNRQQAPATLRPTTSTTAEQVAAATSGVPSSEAPGPTAVAATKQAGAAPVPSARVAEPSPTTPTEISPQTVARAQPGETSPALAQTPTPTPSATRSVSETRPTVATIAAADPSPTRSPSPSESAQPRAAETSVSRQSNSAPTADPTAGVPSVEPVNSPSTQLARAVPSRAAPSTLPSVTPEARPSASPLRSARVASLETSPAPIESPALAEATRPTERPAAEPTRMALAKSTAGVAGIGESSNYDRSTPAPASPAQVASAAAKRAEATQNTAPGPAISPSQSSLVSRSRAGEQSPRSTLLASTDAPNATAGGSSQPSELAASSSASLTRNSANAKPADVSAAAGEMAVDTGTVQIVSAAGAGRAEGGGQPAMNLETNARALARTTTGGAPQVAITATAPGEATTMPAAGGGLPPAIDTSPNASSLVKASSGGPAPVSGSPNTAELSGKPSEAGAAEVVAAVEAGRATPLNTTAGAPAPGGGTTSPSRSATGQSLATASEVPVPALAGGPTPAGGPMVAGSSGTPNLEASATTVARTESGGVAAAGGPSVAPEVGAPADTRSVASAAGGRATSGEPAKSSSATPAPSSAPLARSGGPATLAANTRAEAIVVGTPPMGGQPGGAPAIDAGTPNTAVAKASSAGGQPVSGGLASVQPEAIGPTGSATGGDVVASTEAGRAAATEASSGVPTLAAGGGSPSRSATSQPFSTPATAQTIELAGGPMPGGAPASAGVPGGIPLDATGVEATRGAAAVPGASGAPGGAEAGPIPVESLAGSEVGAALGPRGTASQETEGPVPFTGISAGAPLKRADLAGAPAFGAPALIAINVPAAGTTTGARTDGTPDMDKIAGVVDAGPADRTAAGAIPVGLEAPEGPGGLGADLTPDIGVAGRHAQADSQAISFVPSRFVRKTLGGTPGTSATAVVSAEAFSQRRVAGLRRRGDEPGGDVGRPPRATEDAIELGLFYLSRHQMQDGSWSLTRYAAGRPGYAKEQTPSLSSDTAATGLTLLCFFGAGYHHQDDKYQDQIKRALDWLVQNQKENGDLYVPQDDISNRSNALYSHAIATIALCEAYGMTQDPALKEPAQKALDFIVAAQHKDRGGWRYVPGDQSDTSVTGWMVMALKSGELANLTVTEATYDKVRHWLDMAKGGAGKEHLYVYNPYAPDSERQAHGKRPSKTMTAVGMLVSMYTGKNRTDDLMRRGADDLLEALPAIGDPRSPQRDTYYWYYATQVMFHMKGDYWRKWNEKLHPLLTQSQIQQGPLAGSWDPLAPVPDRWGYHAGRIYVTTMNLLSLEVTYRHLPIYEETAK